MSAASAHALRTPCCKRLCKRTIRDLPTRGGTHSHENPSFQGLSGTRRGASRQAVIAASALENRWRPKGRPWVQIPPPPLEQAKSTEPSGVRPLASLARVNSRVSPSLLASETSLASGARPLGITSVWRSCFPSCRQQGQRTKVPALKLGSRRRTRAARGTREEAIHSVRARPRRAPHRSA